MTPENTELIQKSIYTLVYTLKNVEVIFCYYSTKVRAFEHVKENVLTWSFDCFIVEHKLRYSGIHRR